MSTARNTDGRTFPQFEGWMLWNIVCHAHACCGVPWPLTIFEAQPREIQAAWERAAAELQQRATTLGRLI